MAVTIAVLSQKGGTGKTTAVPNMADVLTRIGLEVLSVDGDPQGNLSDYFDVDPEAQPTLGEVLVGQARAADAIHGSVIPANLGLAISYDDAFIVFINGHEVLREGVAKGNGPNAADFTMHEAQRKFDYFPLENAAKYLKADGKNVIAIEGHNANIKSSDFTLHPTLLLKK